MYQYVCPGGAKRPNSREKKCKKEILADKLAEGRMMGKGRGDSGGRGGGGGGSRDTHTALATVAWVVQGPWMYIVQCTVHTYMKSMCVCIL